jgi:hypothetical protein
VSIVIFNDFELFLTILRDSSLKQTTFQNLTQFEKSKNNYRGGLISGRVKKGAHCKKGGPSPFFSKISMMNISSG